MEREVGRFFRWYARWVAWDKTTVEFMLGTLKDSSLPRHLGANGGQLIAVDLACERGDILLRT